MGRGTQPTCPEDELTLLGLVEQSGKYVVFHDRLPPHSTAAAHRPKRTSRSRRGRNASAGEEKDVAKLQYEVSLRHISTRDSALLDVNSREETNASQARQRTDGAMDVDDPEADAGSHLVQVTVNSTEDDIITPAPGSLRIGRRREYSKAILDDAGMAPTNAKRHRPAAATQRQREAPVGIPTPIKAPIASTAAILQVPQGDVLEDISAAMQPFPSEMVQPDVSRVAEEPAANASGHDPFAQLSLTDLNAILEQRLKQRLVPEFQPQNGVSATATAKKFQQEFLQNRVDHFRAVFKQTQLLTSAHAQIADSLSKLGNMESFPASAKSSLKEDRPALLALIKLCKKAPQLAEQQVEFAAVMKAFHDATTQHEAAEPEDRRLFTREELEAEMTRAADEREAQVREAFSARAAAAPEPADPAMLPLSPELVAVHSTNDSQRDAAIQAIAYTLAPAHRLADKAANIEEVLFDSYSENGQAGEKYWARLKALVLKMCPESYDVIWEATFGAHGTLAAVTDGSSASATGHSAADAVDLQHLDALQCEQAAADSTRGKIWADCMPVLDLVTRA